MRSGLLYVTRPLPLLVLGTLCVALFASNTSFFVMAQVMFLAVIQSVSYALKSRAANRDSNLYHLIAAILPAIVFFLTLHLLITNEVTLELLIPYTLGTVFGTSVGTRGAMFIESKLGLIAHLGKETVRPQKLPLKWAIPGLLILSIAFIPLSEGAHVGIMIAILMTLILQQFLHALLRVARSTTSYWFHLVIVLTQSLGEFFIYRFMVNTGADWFLLAPYVTGTIIGSLLGAESGKRVGERIKTSWDAHMAKDARVATPILETLILVGLIPIQFMIFGHDAMTVSVAILILAAFAQHCAFTIKSRAGQRNNIRYLEWTSVFSNGLWFVTLSVLALSALTTNMIIPYLVGTALGSIWGQSIAMRFERLIGASMNEASPGKATT